MIRKYVYAALAALALSIGLGACSSNADTADKNLIKECEKFNCQRHIVGVNGITDKVLFSVEGKCSLEFPGRRLEVLCKHGDSDFKKHHIGLSDNVTYINVQTKALPVNQYRTKIVLRPEALLPDFDLVTGDNPPAD